MVIFFVWQGLDMAAVKRQGFEAREAVIEDEDARLIGAWAEEMVSTNELNLAHGLQGERSVRAFMVLTKDRYVRHVKEEGTMVENYELAPSAWRPAVGEQRKAVGGGPHDVEAALKRAAVALGVGCGKEGDEEMPLLELLVQEPGLQPPGDWHGDVLSVWPSLGAIAILSERAVPTYFPDVTKDWGAGRELIVSTAAGTGKKRLQGSEERGSQMDDIAYHKVRQLRWERVRASGSNEGEGVAVVNAAGGDLGVTSNRNARAGPRRQGRVSVGDPRRAVVGARPTQRRGSVTYFGTAAAPIAGRGARRGTPQGGARSYTPRGRRRPGGAMGTRRMHIGRRRRRRANTTSSSTRKGSTGLGTALRVSGSPTRSRRLLGRQRRGGTGLWRRRRPCWAWERMGLEPIRWERGEGWVLICTC